MTMKRVTVVQTPNGGRYIPIVGDTILLTKEPSNPVDPNAIRVTDNKGKEFIGYVANSINTVRSGTLSASSSIEFLKTTSTVGFVVEISNYRTRNGKNLNAYTVDFEYVEDNKKDTLNEGAVKMENNEFVVRIIGQKTLYENKFLVADAMKRGLTPTIEFIAEGDKVVALFEGKRCGHIDSKKQEGISSLEEVKSIAVGQRAQVTEQVGMNYLAKFTVSDKAVQYAKSSDVATTEFERIINEGILDEEELKSRISYLKKNKVTDKQLATLLSTYQKYDNEVSKRIPNPKTLFADSSGLVKKSVAYINVGRNLLFEGERGVGKNVLTETLAWAYNRPLYEFSLNSQQSNDDIMGGKSIQTKTTTLETDPLLDEFINKVNESIDKGKYDKESMKKEFKEAVDKIISAKSEGIEMGFEKSALIEAGEVGGILVLDEFNTAFGHVLSVLNSFLDDRRRIEVPGYDAVILDKNAVVIATQNREYTGTFDNNEATIDRFVPIIFPTSESIVAVLTAKVPGLALKTAEVCQKLFEGMKRCVRDGELSERTISIRGFIDACLATEQDITLKEALIDNIANRASDTDERKAIRLIIDTIQ